VVQTISDIGLSCSVLLRISVA